MLALHNADLDLVVSTKTVHSTTDSNHGTVAPRPNEHCLGVSLPPTHTQVWRILKGSENRIS